MVVRPSPQREGANSHSYLREALHCDFGSSVGLEGGNEWFIEGN